MAMTSHVTTWRVNPGRGADFLANVAEAKKLHLKMGADQVWVTQHVSGGHPGTISYMMVFESAEKWGKFADATRTNTEWLALWAKAQQNPSAVIVDQSMYSDLGI
ncbi:MAG: hypothetical protein O2859_08275 [Actinomycetota bacterium]|jgi:hypothetical protein|nr:hypothetical protein [Actinomycetota bacterium]